MVIVWLGVLIAAVIVEAATYALVSVWFALGALAALIAAALGAAIWLQAVLFLAISAAVLLMLRPLVKKQLKKAPAHTNADMALGRQALVTETVDNLAATGEVAVDGKRWTARSATGEVIEKGAVVMTEHIEGVKMFVVPAATEAAERREEKQNV